MPHSKPQILGFGSALIDLLYYVSDEFLSTVEGQKGGRLQLSPEDMTALIARIPGNCSYVRGGATANTIVALANLGNDVSMFCKIGDDNEGRFFKGELAAAGVDLGQCQVSRKFPTGRCLSLITPDSERTMRSCPAASEDITANDISEELFDGVRYMVVEGYSVFDKEMLSKAFALAHKAGVEIHFDLASLEIASVNREYFKELCKEYVYAVYANELEAAALTGIDEPRKALDYLSGICDMPIVKVGKKGAMLRRKGSECISVPAIPVHAVDTTAAGDLWAAGFLHGYINGASLHKAAVFGSMVSAEIVQVTGAALSPETWRKLLNEYEKLI